MKTLIALVLLSSFALAAPLPKDPRVTVAKDVATKLYNGTISVPKMTKVNVLEQKDSFFLIQVTNKEKQNYCFIFAVEITNNTPEISILANYIDANDREVKNAFVQQCSAAPTESELATFKTTNNWPND